MTGPGPRADTTANSQAAAAVRFDTFLLVAAATVLVTRSLLAVTGYPQVGGHTDLHVAHVLWGGLLMGVAVAVMTVSLGSAAKFRATVVGGIGFGLFIDEVGKFLTKDVDYFFKPAVAIIYGVLLTAYVVGRTVLARQRLTPARARALAAVAVVDQSLGQLTDGRGVTEAGWLSSSVLGAVPVVAGLVHLRRHWIHGLQLIRAGLLLELLVTDVFKFEVIQFAALASFAVHAVLLAVVSATIANGRRVETADRRVLPLAA